MDTPKKTYSGFKRFIGTLCFMLFGMVGTFQQGQEFNVVNLIYGLFIGLIFGWISTGILAMILKWINPSLKKTQKRGFARRAVSAGLVFMVPFVLMAFMATYYLHWKSVSLFISAAISAVAVATGGEISKLYEKPKLWNNIIPSIIASGFSMVWIYTLVAVQSLPSQVIGLYTFVTT